MGCAFCLPASAGIDPTVYFPGGLPENVVHVTPESPKELIEEFIDVLATSFCGSYCSPPEAVLSWCYKSPEMSENDHTKMLGNDVTKSEGWNDRVAFFRYIAEWTFLRAGRHGGCFALKDPNPDEDSDDDDNLKGAVKKDGKLVAITVTFPPNKRRLHEEGFCEFIHLMGRLGAEKVPKVFREGGEPSVRLDVLKKAAQLSHETHFPNGKEHLFLYCLGVAPGRQGEGHGRKLITLMGECADRMKVPTYLETAGTRLEGFYGHNGYVVEGHYPMVYNAAKDGEEKEEMSFKPDGLDGFTAMVRPILGNKA